MPTQPPQQENIPLEPGDALEQTQMEQREMQALFDALQVKWAVEERPFTSNLPLIGPLIVRLRELWNNVATRWYVQPLLQQQIEFNSLLVQQLNNYHVLLQEHIDRLDDYNSWLTEQDRETAEQSHQLGEMTAQLAGINRLLTEVEARLERIERMKRP